MSDPTAEAPDDSEVLEENGRVPQRRHDAKPAGVAQKRQAAEPQRRHDSPADVPIDGWGDPLNVKAAPGYVAFMVSEHDIGRLAWRPWSPATWGDPRIAEYAGGRPGEKGTQMRYKELYVYVMREEDWITTQARDPRRAKHAQLKASLFQRAQESGTFDAANPRIRINNPHTGFVNQFQR